MKIRRTLMFVLLGLSLTACGAETSEDTVLDTPMALDTDVAQILSSDSDAVRSFDIAGTKFTTVVPDGYTVFDVQDAGHATPLLSMSTNTELSTGVTIVQWFTVPVDYMGEYIFNPCRIVADDYEDMFPYPEVGDVSLYIAGEQVLTGVPCKSYVDFSTVSKNLPAICIPESSYIFKLDSDTVLVLRVSYSPENLDDFFGAMEQAISGDTITYDLASLASDYGEISATLDQIASECCRFSAFGDYSSMSTD